MAVPETRTYARPAAAALAAVVALWLFAGAALGLQLASFTRIPALFAAAGAAWGFAAWGLHRDLRWAFRLAALLGLVTLFLYPIGTLLGGILLVLLYASRTVPKESAA